MNHELASLYEEDKQERINRPKGNAAEYGGMHVRNLEGGRRVIEILEANELHTAEDFYRAAHILNHGDTADKERAEWDVPPLAAQLRKVEEANQHKSPMSESELKEFEANAPDGPKQALKKWGAEENQIE